MKYIYVKYVETKLRCWKQVAELWFVANKT